MCGLKTTIKLCAEVLLKKVEADEVDDKNANKRQKLDEFLLDFFIEKYGLAKLAKEHTVTFVTALRKHYNDHPRIRMFADLSGAIDEALAPHYCHFYRDTLWQVMKRSGVKKLKIDEHNSEVLLLLDACLEAVPICFKTIGAEELQRLEEKVIENATLKRGEQVPSRISMDAFMGVVMAQYTTMMRARRVRLSQIFTQGDVNGDGVLTLQEFVKILDATNLLKSEREAKDLYREALELSYREGTDADVITPDAFAKVAVVHLLVSEHDEWKAKVINDMAEMIYERKGNLHTAFMALDHNSDGTLTDVEFLEGLRGGLGSHQLTLPQIDILLQLNTAQGNQVDYIEFMRRFQPLFAQMLRRRYGQRADETGHVKRICAALFEKKGSLKNAFESMDPMKSGTIKVAEFENALRNLEVVTEEDELKEVIATVDSNGDGVLTYEEFFSALSVHVEII